MTVTKEDFPDQSPLGGVAFQRELEERAFQLADGKIPVQSLGDFKRHEERLTEHNAVLMKNGSDCGNIEQNIDVRESLSASKDSGHLPIRGAFYRKSSTKHFWKAWSSLAERSKDLTQTIR